MPLGGGGGEVGYFSRCLASGVGGGGRGAQGQGNVNNVTYTHLYIQEEKDSGVKFLICDSKISSGLQTGGHKGLFGFWQLRLLKNAP